jgi:hypothetical protein
MDYDPSPIRHHKKIKYGCDAYIPKGKKIADRINFPDIEYFRSYLEKEKISIGLMDISPCFYMKSGDNSCLLVLDDGPSIGNSFYMCRNGKSFDLHFEE